MPKFSTASDLAVFRALSDRCMTKNQCWPSVSTIARDIGTSRRNAFKCLDRLKAQGFVEIEPGGGRRKTNLYSLWLPKPNGEPDTVNGSRSSVNHETPNGELQDSKRCPSVHPNSERSQNVIQNISGSSDDDDSFFVLDYHEPDCRFVVCDDGIFIESPDSDGTGTCKGRLDCAASELLTKFLGSEENFALLKHVSSVILDGDESGFQVKLCALVDGICVSVIDEDLMPTFSVRIAFHAVAAFTAKLCEANKLDEERADLWFEQFWRPCAPCPDQDGMDPSPGVFPPTGGVLCAGSDTESIQPLPGGDA